VTGVGLGITYWTARVAMMLYAAALGVRLWRRERTDAERWWWTAGCAVFLVHVAAAFGFVHGWSHAGALAATARQTEAMTGVGSGAGLYLNYFFTLVWTADAAWWWVDRAAYERRARPIEWSVHGFMAFMVLNATVVFGTPATRLVGAGVVVSAVLLIRRRTKQQ
jgi:hypothetical protein